MSVVPVGLPRDPLPDAAEDARAAASIRHRMRRLTGVLGLLLAVAIGGTLLLPEPLRTETAAAACVGLVLAGALPLLASALQFSVLGVHRFRSGYAGLKPFYPRVAVLVPAWNEGDVIGATLARLLAMDYPADRLRVYVVDDASTDATPDVVRDWERREPGRVVHLRREKGGQGKAHTLNHGIAHVLAEPWAEALLIIDADVLFEDSTLRRMARHLSHPDVGAVTAYIKEGSAGGNYLTRFVAYEYVTAQAVSRRAQNVFGALACLAGGAQLHARGNLEGIGGRIDTSTLAEDTVTTFRTQLSGRSVVFDGNAVVWAEEPEDLAGLWKQRLRWARGNVQISLHFSRMWLHGRTYGALGRGLFAFLWFTILLMPLLMIGASSGLLVLHAIDPPRAWATFQFLWISHAVVYVFVTVSSFTVDPGTARRAWREGVLFPGWISLAIIVFSVAPGPIGAALRHAMERLGHPAAPELVSGLRVFVYAWLAGSMAVAYAAVRVAARWRRSPLVPLLLYGAGFGAFLTAVTFAAYVKELRGAGLQWDKTIKTGRASVGA